MKNRFLFLSYTFMAITCTSLVVATDCEDDVDWYYYTDDGDTRSCNAIQNNPGDRCETRESPAGVVAKDACKLTCGTCDVVSATGGSSSDAITGGSSSDATTAAPYVTGGSASYDSIDLQANEGGDDTQDPTISTVSYDSIDLKANEGGGEDTVSYDSIDLKANDGGDESTVSYDSIDLKANEGGDEDIVSYDSIDLKANEGGDEDIVSYDSIDLKANEGGDEAQELKISKTQYTSGATSKTTTTTTTTHLFQVGIINITVSALMIALVVYL